MQVLLNHSSASCDWTDMMIVFLLELQIGWDGPYCCDIDSFFADHMWWNNIDAGTDHPHPDAPRCFLEPGASTDRICTPDDLCRQHPSMKNLQRAGHPCPFPRYVSSICYSPFSFPRSCLFLQQLPLTPDETAVKPLPLFDFFFAEMRV